jgi:hypothetical protein
VVVVDVVVVVVVDVVVVVVSGTHSCATDRARTACPVPNWLSRDAPIGENCGARLVSL